VGETRLFELKLIILKYIVTAS